MGTTLQSLERTTDPLPLEILTPYPLYQIWSNTLFQLEKAILTYTPSDDRSKVTLGMKEIALFLSLPIERGLIPT
jgi:hypothetical protein